MAQRCKSTLFYTTILVSLLWLLFIFLSLPQLNNELGPPDPASGQIVWTSPAWSQNDHHFRDASKAHQKNKANPSINPPNSPDYMKYFHLYATKHKQITKANTLFYQFNPKLNLSQAEVILGSIVESQEHSFDTKKLATINSPIDQYVETEGYKLFAFNLLISNRIGLVRSLPETRNERCPGRTFGWGRSIGGETNSNHNSSSKEENSLPKLNNVLIKLKASIVICYYNEAPSALLRTIYTIILRSPRELLEEIIIVDDFSELDYSWHIIKPFISDYGSLVKIVRTSKREGLIRARLFGASLTRGDVLIFLDSHVEANTGWLEPLLEVIQENNTTIACPMIDLINYETLIYTGSPMVKGGLNWALNFKWDSVEANKLITYEDFIKPIESPTLAGGLYAIRRNYFYELGDYDSNMNLWGGENIEMSLRTWMCGGRIVILPCSRFGHIFRKRRPYGPKEGEPDSLLYNSHRAARVWLEGEHLEKFYEANPAARGLDSGDVGERLELKRKLACKNFDWYLERVYPKLKEAESKDEIGDFSGRRKNLFKSRNSRQARKISDSANNIRRVPYMTMAELLSKSAAARKSRDLKRQFEGNQMKKLPKIINKFQVQSLDSHLCIESNSGYLARSFTRLILNECAILAINETTGDLLADNVTLSRRLSNQIFSETELGDFRLGDENECLDLMRNLPLLRKCHSMGSFQNWSHHSETGSGNNSSLYNSAAGLCLGVERVQIGEPIIVTVCDRKLSVGNTNETINQNSLGQWMQRPKRRLAARQVASSLNYFQKSSGALVQLKPCQRWNLISLAGDSTTTTIPTKSHNK